MAIEEIELEHSNEAPAGITTLQPHSGRRAAALVLYWLTPEAHTDRRGEALKHLREVGGADPLALDMARQMLTELKLLRS